MWVYVLMTITCVGFAGALQLADANGLSDPLIVLPDHQIQIRQRYLLMLLAFLPLLLVTGLRYQVGTDYQSYINMAVEIRDRGFTYRAETGYIWLNRLVLLLSQDPVWIIFFTCLLSYGLVCKTILDLSPAIPFSLYYFITAALLQPSLNLIRQFIAVAIAFYGIRYLYKNPSWLKYLVTVAVAVLFHKTALIWLPLALLSLFRYKKRHYALMIIALAGLFLVRNQVLEGVLRIFYPGYIGSRYVDRVIFNELQVVTSLLHVALVMRYRKTLDRLEARATPIINLVYFRAMIATLLAWVPMLWRILIYLDITAVIFIPLVIRCEPDRKVRRLYYMVFIALATVYVWYSARFQNSHDVLPYRTIFSR